jgi:peptidoglycan/xylan/chitin deacetylase (PgdA/CDA1 family)/glycosyltransferase involved in cell wall biosynthesis
MKQLAVIVTSEFGKQGGGLSKSCHKFASMLKTIQFNVKIVLSTFTSHSENQIIEEFEIITNSIQIAKGGYKPELYKHLFLIGCVENIYNQLKETKPNIIIAFGGGENALFASELKNKFSCKLMIMLRGSEMNLSISDSNLFHANYESLKNSDAVIALSNELLNRAKQIYFNPNTYYAIIPNTIEFTEKYQDSLRQNNIIFGIGAKNINEKKGIANLILATHHLNNLGNEKFYLRIAGQVDSDLKKEYLDYLDVLGISDKVKFLNNLNEFEFRQELQEWDFVIQSSFREGFSNTIGEAISLGKLFFITNTGYIAENIKFIGNELIFENFCPKTIAKQIYQTYFSANILQKVISVKEYFQRLVASEKVKTDWIRVFDKLQQVNSILPISNQHILSVILHDISEKNYSNIDIPKSEFERLCSLVHSKGFRFVSAKEYFQSDFTDNLIICTFDDAYQNVYDLGFPILQKFNFTATVFVCSDYIDISNSWNKKDKKNRKHLDLENLKNLENQGWEIGSHGTNHFSFLRLDTEQILNTLSNSKYELEKHFKNVVSFAYPYGDFNYHISKTAKSIYENIFAVDTGGTHIRLDRYQIRRYSTDELIKILQI